MDALLGALPAEGALSAVLAQATAGVGLLDRDLRYVAVNEALAAMNRLSAAEHLGRTVREVLSDRVADALEPMLLRVLAGEEISDVELGPSDDAGRRFRVSYLPVRDGEEVVGVLGVLVDVTGGRRAEQALRLTEQRLQLALDGTGVGSYEWEIAGDRVRWSATLAAIAGRPAGWAPEGLEGFLEIIHPDDRARLSDKLQASLDRAGAPYEATFRFVRPDGTSRWAHARGHVTRDDAGVAQGLVGIVADVHQDRLRQIADEFMAEASLALAGSLDPEQTLREVAELSLGELADCCAVHVVQPDGTLETVAVTHSDPRVYALAQEFQTRYPPDPEAPDGIHSVIRTGTSVLQEEITPEMVAAVARGEDHVRLIRAIEPVSSMIVPLPAGGAVLGTISFFYTGGGGRRYTPQTLALAEELGRRAGLALANARLHRAEQDANRRLRQLQAVTDVTLSRLPLDGLLTELLGRVRELLDTDIAVCLLLEPEDRVLVVHAALGLDEEARERTRIPVGAGIAGRIVLEDDVVIVEDVPAARPVSRHLRESARSLMGIALRSEGRKLGVLHVATREPRAFTAEDAELLSLVADRVGRAVDQAAAYERERETALTLQRSLLPAVVPEIEGLQIATRYFPGQVGSEVGGDWYDVVDLPDGRHAICVGDVVGRGVRAAAVMGRLRSSLRAYLHVAPGPVPAMAMLDDLVFAAGDVTFATVMVAVIDSLTGRAELCSAGHPPAVIGGAGGRCQLVRVPVGRPLGVAPAPRASATVELPVGAPLLLYTDGLVERRGTSIDDRLAELCRVVGTGPRDPEALLDHVVAAMVGGHERRDDVALVGAWRRG